MKWGINEHGEMVTPCGILYSYWGCYMNPEEIRETIQKAYEDGYNYGLHKGSSVYRDTYSPKDDTDS